MTTVILLVTKFCKKAHSKPIAWLACQQVIMAYQQMDKTLHKIDTGLNAQIHFNKLADKASVLESKIKAESELN